MSILQGVLQRSGRVAPAHDKPSAEPERLRTAEQAEHEVLGTLKLQRLNALRETMFDVYRSSQGASPAARRRTSRVRRGV
jgi:hypothetical protein